MELYLIRHAQSLNNALPVSQRVEDPPLSDIGHQQCHHLARRIASLELGRMVTSPFLRALQTADHLARSTKLSPQVCVDLHEQGGCVSGFEAYIGRPGLTGIQIGEQFPGFTLAEDIDGDGWWGSQPFETQEAARQRAARLLAGTLADLEATAARVAFVTHGDFQRLLLAEFCREPLDVPYNASISKVSIGSSGYRLEQYNSVVHLPPHLITS